MLYTESTELLRRVGAGTPMGQYWLRWVYLEAGAMVLASKGPNFTSLH